MYLLKKISFILVATNITDNAYPLWSATTWAVGAFVVKDDIEYEALTAATATDIPKKGSIIWEKKGTINSKSWGDDYITTQTSMPNEIYMKFDCGAGDKIVFFELEAVEVVIVHTIDGVAETYTIETLEINCGDEPMEYVYGDEDYIRDLVVDLELSFESTVEIWIKNPSDIARVGNIEFGRFIDTGATLWGGNVGFINYTRYDTDDYGNTEVIKGIKLKDGDIDVTLPTKDVDRVLKIFKNASDTRSVIIGDNREKNGLESMLYYGWIKELMFVLVDGNESKYTAEITSSN